MSVNGVASGKPATADLIAKAGRDLFAGLVTSVMAVAYGLSFAALIFAPPLTPWIAYGIAATFLTSAVAAAIVSARSSLPFAIGGPDGATAAITASLIGALVERLIASGAPHHPVGLHRRRVDRRYHWLRDLRREREPCERGQIQF